MGRTEVARTWRESAGARVCKGGCMSAFRVVSQIGGVGLRPTETAKQVVIL